MTEQKFETGKSPNITIKACSGDLNLQGWPGNSAVVVGKCKVEAVEGGLDLFSSGDLRLQVPFGSSVRIEDVAGDLALRELYEDISIGHINGDTSISGIAGGKIGVVNGDLSLMHMKEAMHVETANGDMSVRFSTDINVGRVNGDLSVNNMTGSVAINDANGDLSLRSISGDVTMERVRRDANLSHIGGKITAENIEGDARIRGPLEDGVHVVKAGGDIVVRWPASAPLNLIATASEVINRLPLENVEEAKGRFEGNIDAGKVNLELTAKGDIVLKEVDMFDEKWEGFNESDFGFDMDLDLSNLGNVISSQVNAHVARVTSQIEEKFGGDFGQKLAEKVARQTERAAERAERAAERAQQRAERHQRFGRPPRPVTPPAPPRPRVSSEEQMKILKMVESGAISPDEASMLLAALEG